MTSTRSPSPSAVSPRRLRATNCPFTAVATLLPWKPSSSSTRSSRATATSRDLPFKTMRIALLHTCRCAERQVCRPPRHRRRQQEAVAVEAVNDDGVALPPGARPVIGKGRARVDAELHQLGLPRSQERRGGTEGGSTGQ